MSNEFEVCVKRKCKLRFLRKLVFFCLENVFLTISWKIQLIFNLYPGFSPKQFPAQLSPIFNVDLLSWNFIYSFQGSFPWIFLTNFQFQSVWEDCFFFISSQFVSFFSCRPAICYIFFYSVFCFASLKINFAAVFWFLFQRNRSKYFFMFCFSSSFGSEITPITSTIWIQSIWKKSTCWIFPISVYACY